MIAAAFTDSSAFALSMLGVILLSFGVLLTLPYCMYRNASRRDLEVDRLIEELEENEKSVAATESTRQEWERDGDWWKS